MTDENQPPRVDVDFDRVATLLDVVEGLADFNLPNLRSAALEMLKELDKELQPDPAEFKPNLPFPPEPARAVPIGGAHSPQGPAGFTDAAGNVVEDKEPPPEPPVEDPPPPPINGDPLIDRRV